MWLWDPGAASHDQTVASWKRISRLFQGNLGWWNIIIWPDKYPSLGKWSIKVPFPFQRSFSPGQFVMVSLVVFFTRRPWTVLASAMMRLAVKEPVKLQMVFRCHRKHKSIALGAWGRWFCCISSHTWMFGWKLGSMVSKWVISPT